MSHTTTIKGVAIKDERALRQAVKDLQNEGLNIRLEENATPRMYFDYQEAQVGRCPYVVRCPGRFDVGFQRTEDGSLQAVCDLDGGSIASTLGATCPMPGTMEARNQHSLGRLYQAYSKNAMINAARSQGYAVEVKPDGENVQIICSGM